jgi:acetyl/propionyl-CoA carboxylase alpha subunit
LVAHASRDATKLEGEGKVEGGSWNLELGTWNSLLSTEIVMPRLSDTMDQGTIARWTKKPGDPVKRGEVLAEIETDKANMDLESYADGIMARIMVKEG